MSAAIRRAGLATAVVACVAFSNTLDCGFCYDDKTAIVQNSDLRPNSPWSNLLWNDFWGFPMDDNSSHKSYRPLCVATFRLNYLLHELQPMGYHLVNVLLHSAVCYLYVQLCGVLFSEVWPALIAGLLFAVHPIHTEAVSGVVGRAELMSSIFFLLSLLCYLGTNSGKGLALTKLGLSLMCSLLSVLSKEQGLMALGVCLVLDLIKTRSSSTVPLRIKPFLWRTLTVFTFGTCILAWRLWLMHTPPMFKPEDNEALALNTPYRQLHWAHLIFVNAKILLMPTTLLHDYRMNAIPLITSLSDPRNLLTLLTFTTITILVIYSFSKSLLCQDRHRDSNRICDGQLFTGSKLNSAQIMAISLSLIILPFLPSSNLFFTVGFVVAERVLYLPSMGLCLLVTLGVYRAKSYSRFGSLVIQFGVALLLLSYSAKTLQRNRDWVSKTTLYRSAVKHFPTNGFLISNLAREYSLEENDTATAESLYRYGIDVAPNVYLSYVNYGSLLKSQGRLTEAEILLKEGLKLMTASKAAITPKKQVDVYTTLANIVASNGTRLDEALTLCNAGIQLGEGLPYAHNAKGAILSKLNRWEEARREFKEAVRLLPHNADAHYNLGVILLKLRDNNGARTSFQNALTVNEKHALAKLKLLYL